MLTARPVEYLSHDSSCQDLLAVFHDQVDELAVEQQDLTLEPESEAEAVRSNRVKSYAGNHLITGSSNGELVALDLAALMGLRVFSSFSSTCSGLSSDSGMEYTSLRGSGSR